MGPGGEVVWDELVKSWLADELFKVVKKVETLLMLDDNGMRGGEFTFS